jgi:ribonuclease Z
MEITFLGTSTTMPSKTRNTTAIHIQHMDNRLLFDCGEGTQRQMMLANLSVFKLSAIFISHLHADHVLGLGGIIQSMAFLGREKELFIFGPPKIKKYIDFYQNWDYFDCPYKITTKEVKDGKVFDDTDYSVSAFEVEHGFPAFGFVFEEKTEINLDKKKLKKLGLEGSPICRELKEKGEIEWRGKQVRLEDIAAPHKLGKKIAYTGDSKPCPNLAKWSKNADLLICDATFSDDLKQKAHDYWHMTVKDAARVAKEADVGKLVLTHFSPRYEDVSELVKEAKAVFKDTVAAEDFMKLVL